MGTSGTDSGRGEFDTEMFMCTIRILMLWLSRTKAGSTVLLTAKKRRTIWRKRLGPKMLVSFQVYRAASGLGFRYRCGQAVALSRNLVFPTK